ncbi:MULTISPECIES: hypothetical protein [unclassified Sinorhizobium]|uniref:hypothetical protein n=1 Tax=unclassified Sinorhizobium TaxID=2613772 RepID=UPI0035254D32
MENIIELAEKRSKVPRKLPSEPTEAKILLFTGVRYERLDRFPSATTTKNPARADNKK